jgi:hypothetical protein
MANNTAAWVADHAYFYEQQQAALARTAVARDIADLREEWDLHVRIYGATGANAAQTAEVELAFVELESLGYESGELNAFENAYRALDEKIFALTCAAFERNANPVALAVDSWFDAQRAAFAAAA